MFRINSLPGKAASKKGHVSFPEDFSLLRPGEDFTAWKVGNDWEIETTLSGSALKERLQIFKKEIDNMGNGYIKLSEAVKADCSKYGGTFHPEGCVQCGGKCFHRYCDKFKWGNRQGKSLRGGNGS